MLAHGAGLPIVTDEPVPEEPPEAGVDPEPSVLIRPSGVGGEGIEDLRNRQRIRPRYVVVAVGLVAVAVAGWVLRPTGPVAVSVAPPPATAGNAAGKARSGGSASAGTGPVVAVPSVVFTGSPDGPGSRVSGPAATGPAVTGPAVTGPAVTGPAPGPMTGGPGSSPSPSPPSRSPSPPAPAERTLSSSAGSVRATCPAAETARILSWTAAKSYQVVAGDTTAGPAPTVIFRHGNTRVTVTVSCGAGVPSATTT